MTRKTFPIRQISKTQPDGRVFIDTPDGDESPCADCGACCSHFRVSFYYGELDAVGGSVPAETAQRCGTYRACMNGTETGGRCAQLRGKIGEGPIACAIYAERPSVCREYPVWLPDGEPNPDCQRLRALIGLAPLAANPETSRFNAAAEASFDAP